MTTHKSNHPKTEVSKYTTYVVPRS